MKIQEYNAARHAEAVRRRKERTQAAFEKYEAAAELADARAEIEQILTDTRENLTPVPTQGAAWNAETRYIAGDTVEGGYVALKYSRNKNPADYLGVYWAYDEAEIVAWDTIEDGTIIYEGGMVTYNNKTWKCTAQHMKSSVYKPKSGSTKWEEVTE